MSLNGGSVRFVILALALVAIGVNVYLARWWRGDVTSSTRATSPTGFRQQKAAYNNMSGSIPGNPEAAEANLKLLYEKMLVYKRKYGRLPAHGVEPQFTMDMARNYREYGFSKPQDALLAFRNPDAKYADDFKTAPHPENISPYVWVDTRPDGSRLTETSVKGGRDPLVYTDIYFHHSGRQTTNGHYDVNLIGFYLVLWEDGQVQRIPQEQVRFVYPRPAGSSPCFPGQAGVPATTYTYEEYWRQVKPLGADGKNPNVMITNKSARQ